MGSKFKAGDIVRCMKDCHSPHHDEKDSFTEGKAYTVLEIEKHTPIFGDMKVWYSLIVIDNNGIRNGWNEKFFEYFPDEVGHLAGLLAG